MSVETAPLDWFLQPLSGALEHHLSGYVAWHGRGMVLAWAIFVPLGILVARYFKVTRRQDWPQRVDNRFWWHAHRTLQLAAFAISIAALWSVRHVAGSQASVARAHALAGWCVLLLGLLQVLSGFLRGTKGGPTGERSAVGDWHGDHYDMTPRRVAFEYLHKFGGWFATALALVALVSGLVVADAPRWMLVVVCGWWLLLAGCAYAWQRQGRCLDTYQAIWGPDPVHPGNRRPPIGPGVRQVRVGPSS